MLGSVIPRRVVLSLALVGLVSIFVASYSAVWANPASAAAPTLASVQGPSSISVTTGQIVQIVANATDSTGAINNDNGSYSPAITAWGWTVASGSCTLDGSTTRKTVLTAPSSAGTCTVGVAAQAGGWVTANEYIVVNVSAPSAAVAAPVYNISGDGTPTYATDEALNEAVVKSGDFDPSARGGNISRSTGGTVSDANGNSVSISPGVVAPDNSAVVVVESLSISDLAAAPPMQQTGSTSGTFKFGSSAIAINFYANLLGQDGLIPVPSKISISEPAEVCMTYTVGDLNNAYGGPDGLNIWHYDSTQWVKLSTNVYTNPNKVCAYTSNFSPFAVGMDVAPPLASAVVDTGLPATGGYSPNAMTLLLAMVAGFARS